MSMSEAGGPTNPQEAGDAAFLRPVVVAIHHLFASLWAQTDLEFSPLRPGQGRVLPVPGVSLGSDRFRIFSAQAKGAFQCQEISPRVRFALEQSGESRRQVRDALGVGEAKERHELGAGDLGMVLRQVGEGSAGRRAGATRGELAPVDPVPAAHRLDHQGEIQSSKQASLPAQVAMGLIAEALAQTIQESLTAEEPSMPCLGPTGGQAG